MVIVSGDLMKALDDVEKLITDLASLGKIDMAKLEDAEKRFKIANETIMGRLDREVENLKQISSTQEVVITQYELNLEPFRAEIKHVDAIYEAIPKRCMKKRVGLETR